MNILYSKKNMVNSFEGCAIGKFYNNKLGLVLFNKNIIKFYDFDDTGNVIFLFDKFLLENVLQIETYKINPNEDGLIILFESTKISSIHFVNETPVVNSLKCFERDHFDIRLEDHKFLRIGTDLVFVKISKRYFGLFSVNKSDFSAQVFCFTDIDEKVKNIIDLVFLSNYVVPTFCIVYDSTPKSYITPYDKQAIICSFDSKLQTFYVIDEFNVPSYTQRVLFDSDMLVFISENEIFCKTTDSSFILPLNKASQYFTNENVKNITIQNAQFYCKDRHLLIFNGDGMVYYIYIEIDSGRIIDLKFNASELFYIPRYIFSYKDYLFFGSNESSFILKITKKIVDTENIENDNIKKAKLNMTELEIIINNEYEKIYGTTIDSIENIVLNLEILYEFPGVGYINDLCVRNDNEFICCSEGRNNFIIEFSNFLNFESEKIFDCTNFEKIILFKKKIFLTKAVDILSINGDDHPVFNELNSCIVTIQHEFFEYVVTKEKILTFENDKEIQREDLNHKIISCKYKIVDSNLVLCLLNDRNILELRNIGNGIIKIFTDVSSFCLNEKYCVINTRNNLIFYDLRSFQKTFFIADFTNLNFEYNLENIKNLIEREYFFKIVEIEIIQMQNTKYLFCINEKGKFSVYKFSDNFLKKIFIDELIEFVKQKNGKYFIKIEDFIYLNAKKSYFLYVNNRNEFFFYKSKVCIRDILNFKEKNYFLIHDKLISANLPKTRKVRLMKKSNLFVNFKVSNDQIFDKFIFKKILVEKSPKNIEVSGNYILLASSKKVKFLEQPESLDVYTQKYSIDLFTNNYKLISSFELENDEYVFDIKELSLNDVIGKNGKSKFIVVCVTKIEGEDKHSRGRLIVLELIDIVIDETNKHKDKKLKLIASENIKGCITKCDEIEGNVIVALGIKTMIYKIDRSEGLIPIGIHDLNTLTTSLMTIKNYVVFSDIYRGLSFFYFQKKPVRLNLLCTSEPVNYGTHVDFLVRDSSLGVVCTDINGNMNVYTYSPLNILSYDGTKFVKRCVANFNLGRLISKRSHFKICNPIFISDSNNFIELDSFSEETYQCFLKTQNFFLSIFDDTFGLNPMNFNNFEFHLKPPSIKKPIIMEVILRFLHLPIDVKKDIENEESKIFKYFYNY